MKYAVCDLETTGLGVESQIIEIAILVIEDEKVVDSYQTLINPMVKIGDDILKLTKISARQIEAAPKFYDVAPTVMRLLSDKVFVSHKTDFDYEVLKRHFASLGMSFEQKTYCTLKKGQEIIPGLASYSLDSLCGFFEIPVRERHRALSDAQLCFELFLKLKLLTLPRTQADLILPHHQKLLNKVPHASGNVFLLDDNQVILSKQSGHNLYEMTKALLSYSFVRRDFLGKVKNVQCEVTHSELLAQLRLELNYPQKHNWGLYWGEKKTGERVLYVDKLRKKQNVLWSHESHQEVVAKLKSLRPKNSQHLVYQDSSNSKDQIVQKNIEMNQLIKNISHPATDYLLSFETGVMDKSSFILVRGYSVRGLGQFDKSQWDEVVLNPEKFLVERWPHSFELNQIVRQYVSTLKNHKFKKEALRILAPKLKKIPERKMHESQKVQIN